MTEPTGWERVDDRACGPGRSWRARVFVTASDRRLRLPRDLFAAVISAAIAATAWSGVATGEASPAAATVPQWISWVVTGVAVCGTSIFIALAVALCILGRRWSLVTHVVIAAGGAGMAAWGVASWLGDGVPAAPPLVAVTFATAFLVIRILGVPLRTPLWTLVYLAGVAQVFDSHLVPLGTVGAAALGVAAGAGVAFGFGSLDVAPTLLEVGQFLDQLGVTVTDLEQSDTVAIWGAARFTGTGGDGAVLDVDIYGRDAPEGQFLSRAWRFLWIRRSTLDLRFRRIDHIEHAAGLMLWAGAQGVGAPTVVRAGRVEPTDDAVLVTRRPDGTRLGDLAPDEIDDKDIVALWHSLETLSGAGLALNDIGPETVLVGPHHRVAFVEFASAEAMAADDSRARDAACLLVTTAGCVGTERAVGAAVDVLGPARVEGMLPLIQPQVTSGSTGRNGGRSKKALAELRLEAATILGVDAVEPQPLARFQLSQLLMLAGTAFGLSLLVGQLIGLSGIGDLLADSIWWWVLATLLVTQATSLTEAISMSGTVPVAPPIGPLTLLRFAMSFTGLIGGTVATTATVIRFNQRRGMPPSVAVSSGLAYSIAGFIVQIVLTVVTLCFSAGAFQKESAGPAGSGPENLELVLFGVVAVSLVVGVAFMVPKIRRVVVSRVAPQFSSAWLNVRTIAQAPAKLVRIFGGAAITQLLMAVGLGFALRSMGTSAPFGGLIIVCTFTALLGGMAPVPGGIGVMEASYISGLSLLGVPQDQAIAATVVYRACTTYLPPLWGWGALVWLRRHDWL